MKNPFKRFGSYNPPEYSGPRSSELVRNYLRVRHQDSSVYDNVLLSCMGEPTNSSGNQKADSEKLDVVLSAIEINRHMS